MYNGVVMTGGCSGSRSIPASDTVTERLVESFRGGPTLFLGEVRRYKGWDSPWRQDNLIQDVAVRLTAEKKEQLLQSDSNGRFEAVGIGPGRYRLDVSVPGLSVQRVEDTGRSRFNDGVPSTINIPEAGCVQTTLMMWPDQSIRGTVRDVEGMPVGSVAVRAYEIDDRGQVRPVDRMSYTKPDGSYVLPRFMNGTYLVGVNGERHADEGIYRMTFHPSAHSQLGAARLALEGKDLNNVDITLDRKRRIVRVNVRVEFGDGKPVPMALLSMERDDKGSISSDASGASSRFTNSDGVATLTLFEDDDYVLSASWLQLERGRTLASGKSNRVRIRASADEEVKLTMTADPKQPK
jgi:hypothetical protein